MSRIGQNPISIPEGVKVLLDGSKIRVSGSNGSLEFNFRKEMDISQNDGLIIVKRTSDNREHRSLHGTTRQMINNMVIGVSKGFSKDFLKSFSRLSKGFVKIFYDIEQLLQ